MTYFLPLFVILFFLPGCSPSSLEDFQHEGEARCRQLVLHLNKIHTREELLRAEALLKKEFNKIVDLILEARRFQESHPEEGVLSSYELSDSEALKEELKRIYRIEGGRELIERAQREALHRLDAFERNSSKRKLSSNAS